MSMRFGQLPICNIHCLCFVAGLLVFCQLAGAQNAVSVTLDTTFRVDAFEHDSVVLGKYVVHAMAQLSTDDEGYNVYHAAMFYPSDSSFKVLNVYAEVSGGATYNPAAYHCIMYHHQLFEVGIEGAVFRMDKLTDSTYLIYTNIISRLASTFKVYQVLLSGKTIIATTAESHGNYIFDLIDQKNQQIDPKALQFDFTNRADQDVYDMLRIDTTMIDLSEFYFDSESPFLSYPIESPVFYSYYKHAFGDELSKILRIDVDGTPREILLAMQGGDSDTYSLSSSFIDDSTFVQQSMYTETTKDETDLMAYAYDSTLITYRYNTLFEFKEVAREHIKSYKVFKILHNSQKIAEWINHSASFSINNIQCRWRFTATYPQNDGSAVTFKMQLLNDVTDSVMLDGVQDIVRSENIDMYSQRLEDWIDVNFDGYIDFVCSNNTASGSSGTFYDCYLYVPAWHTYVYSEAFSGYELTVNENNRTVNYFAKNGAANHYQKTIYVGADSKISYSEETSTTYISGDRVYEKVIYTKTVNGKIVKKKTYKNRVE